jgi:transcriptional regulator with XRE-family HTH domain
MPTHLTDHADANRRRLAEDREFRWMYLEELARLEIVHWVQKLMKLAKLSQKELAKRSGTTQPMVSRFLCGDDDRSPTLETLVKFADALDKDVRVEFVERLPADVRAWQDSSQAPSTSGWAGAVAQVIPITAARCRSFVFQRQTGVIESECEVAAEAT